MKQVAFVGFIPLSCLLFWLSSPKGLVSSTELSLSLISGTRRVMYDGADE